VPIPTLPLWSIRILSSEVEIVEPSAAPLVAKTKSAAQPAEAPADVDIAYIAALGLCATSFVLKLIPVIFPFAVLPETAKVNPLLIPEEWCIVNLPYEFDVLPPTMIATAISYVVCGKYSIYESQLPTRRDSPAHWPEYITPLLRRIKVRDVGIKRIKPLLINTPTKLAIDEIENDKLVALPVIDSSGKFVGIVHLRDLVIAKDKTIEKIVKPCKYVSLESTLDEALAIMAENDIDFAPVVENGVYLGVVTLEAEIKAYRDALRKIYGR